MVCAKIYSRELEDDGWVKHNQPVHEAGTKIKIS